MTLLIASLATTGARAETCEEAGGVGSSTVADPCIHDTALTGGNLISGAHVYPTIELSGSLRVDLYDEAVAEPSGWLWLRADRIVINADGDINADAKGYGGTTNNGGPGLGASIPKMMPMQAEPSPGGGGSHSGAGGVGLSGPDRMACAPFLGNACDVFAGATAGVSYDGDPMAPAALVDPIMGMGSAGGASHSGCPSESGQLQLGGRGGGVVILSARSVRIDGTISANGQDSPPIVQPAPVPARGAASSFRPSPSKRAAAC